MPVPGIDSASHLLSVFYVQSLLSIRNLIQMQDLSLETEEVKKQLIVSITQDTGCMNHDKVEAEVNHHIAVRLHSNCPKCWKLGS